MAKTQNPVQEDAMFVAFQFHLSDLVRGCGEILLYLVLSLKLYLKRNCHHRPQSKFLFNSIGILKMYISVNSVSFCNR